MLWSYFEALNLVKEWGYDGRGVRIWRKIDGIDQGFFHIFGDSYVVEVANYGISNNIDGNI